MRKYKLTKEEQWIEDHMKEFVPVSREEFAAIKKTIELKKRDAVLNIRVNSLDLALLKQKAQKIGVKYQSFISELLHRAAEA
ncbi:MAG TPA: hypothetical protein PLJ26_00465 [Candidatus Omnitrophota bacterium]|nr:hypothetical protein [Candidatus Omnitrophota bacterium]